MTADAPLQQRFGLTVTPQNVLGVRAVVLQEAQDLQDFLNNENRYLTLQHLGTDFVSRDMSLGFNEATKHLMNSAQDHVTALIALGDELGATARDYGHTEAEITASYERTAVSQSPLTFRQAMGLGEVVGRPSPQCLDQLMRGGK